MANSVRITVNSFAGHEASPEIVDTATFASPAAAVAGVASGFLVVTPSDGHSPQVAIAVAAIKMITQT